MKIDDGLLSILDDFGIKNIQSVDSFGNGLINSSCKVSTSENSFLLQKINQQIFSNPEDIASNLKKIGDYLMSAHPDYFFVNALKDKKGRTVIKTGVNDWYRVFPFVKDSRSIDTVESENQAYEAARQFGKFTKNLSRFPSEKLKIILPDFHNLIFRHSQLSVAINDAKPERLKEATQQISKIREHAEIISIYEKIKSSPAFMTRVTHHDTKISNVLFDKNDKGICVVDMDTVMPGFFISDFGDMMRTYLSPSSEEDNDFEKILVRNDFFKAIVEGYLEQMSGILNHTEREMLVYSGLFMSYMQGMRFLTDYLANDKYYGASYEQHNLVRASNQLKLFTRLLEKEKDLKRLI